MDNGKNVVVNYKTDVDNHSEIVEKGHYLVQSVHVFGNRATSSQPKFGDENLNAAYLYGTFSPKGVVKARSTAGETAQYSGDATYRLNTADINTGVSKGKSSFKVDFGAKKITDGKLDFTATGHGTFNIPDMAIGNNDPSKGQQAFATSGFSYGKNYELHAENEVKARGHFFGEKAQYLGGVFHTKEGVGTFFSKEK